MDSVSVSSLIEKYEEILSKDPTSYSFAPLADLYRHNGELDNALNIARNGCKLHPEFAAGQMALALACMEKSEEGEALNALKIVVAITPENLEAQRLLSGLYLKNGNLDEAEKCLKIILSLEPDDIGSRQVMEKLGFYKVTKIKPDDTKLEEFLDELDPDVVEMSDSDIVEEFEPINDVKTSTMAELYVKQGHVEKALGIYRDLLQEDPGNATYETRIMELQKDNVPDTHDAEPSITYNKLSDSSSRESAYMVFNDWLSNIQKVKGYTSSHF